MSNELIIRHCAPTLAGIKMGNLFTVQYQDEAVLRRELAGKNQLLSKKGLIFQILRCKSGVALIYVYRIKKLRKLLENPEVRAFLGELGYTKFAVAPCFARLQLHLMEKDFPHEIGIFLGYPLGDIRGFMEHKGANCKCTGYWKVYTDEESALRTFAQYKKCSCVYKQRYIDGFDITRLTVAG